MPKSKGQENNTWESIFCSLMLIIVAFFVFLVSVSLREQAKMQAFQSQFQQESPEATRTARETPPFVEQEADGVGDAIVTGLGDDLGRVVARSGLGDGFFLEQERTGARLGIPADILFASGESRFEERAIPFLEEISELARKRNLAVRIEGHADNQPIRSLRYPSNWELSAARAISVLRYFQETGGIPAARLSAAGFGEHQPREVNDTPEGRRGNRRVEIIFEPPKVREAPAGFSLEGKS